MSSGACQETSQAKPKKEGTKAQLPKVTPLPPSESMNKIRHVSPTPLDYAMTYSQVTVPLQMSHPHTGHKELKSAAAGLSDGKCPSGEASEVDSGGLSLVTQGFWGI